MQVISEHTVQAKNKSPRVVAQPKQAGLSRKILTAIIVGATMVISGAIVLNLDLFSIGETVALLLSLFVLLLMISQREPSHIHNHSRPDF
ncbi:MAG: hypothetical protein ACRCYO_08105 [Bacteroidia bacterium]